MKRFSIAGAVTLIISCLLLCVMTVVIPNDNGGSYSFVWLSDTQYYSRDHSAVLDTLTSLIASEQSTKDIRYAFHTGDVVDDSNDKAQWQFADEALSKLESKIPLIVSAGNHDIGQGADAYSKFISFFGASRYKGLATYGGSYKDGEARYDTLDADDDRWLFLAIGFGIDAGGIDWANSVLARYPDRTVIICTHSYLETDGTLTTEGKEIFDKVVSRNPNVRLVLCGHRHSNLHTSVALDDNKDGKTDRTVYEILSDYQEEGELGYFTLISYDSTTKVMNFQPSVAVPTGDGNAASLESFSIDLAG